MAKMATLQFGEWSTQTYFTVPSSFSVSNDNLVCPPGALYANPVAYTKTSYDMTGSSFDVEIVNPGSGGIGLEAWFGVRPDPTASWSNEAGYYIGGDGTLMPLVYVNGTSTLGPSTTYNATNHKYLRVRESGGTTYWEGSANRGTWTQLWSRTNPFQMTTQYAYVGSSLWQNETGIVNPVYGDVNGGTPGPTGDAGADQTAQPWSTVTLTGTGTGTWSQVSGPTVTLSGSGATRTFTAPPSMSPQSLVFDYGGDTTTITIPRARTGIRQADGSVKPLRVRLVAPSQGYEQVTLTKDPTVRSYASRSIDYGAGPHYMNKPWKVEVGDLLVAMILLDTGTLPAASTLYSGTGFTERHRAVSSEVRFSLATKVAVSSDTTNGTYTVGGVGSGPDGCAIVFAIRDWSGSTTNIRSAVTGTTNTAWTTPSVTPVTTRSLVMSFIGNNGNSGAKVWGWVPPVGAAGAGYTENTGGWTGGAASSELYTGTTATGTRTWKVNTNSTATLRMGATIAIPGGTTTMTVTQMLSQYTQTGGTGGPLTDTTDNTYTDSTGLSSLYHLFADGLDWSKKVGLMVYTDGSDEFGLKTPQITSQSPYLLYGTNGLIAVAKRQNMVLLTPRAPGDGCRDGDGECWYDHSFNGVTPWQKLEWSDQLIRWVLTRYNIDRTRIAIGGYSSGAQWTMSWWGPRYGPEIMMDGVAVAISYGGEPRVNPALTAAYKSGVEHVWDVGDQDTAYTQPMWWNGVQTGRQWYIDNGVTTTNLVLVPNKGHDRHNTTTMVGEFGPIMEREITARVPPA